MLKADMHLHSMEDPQDNLTYPATELIDKAAEFNFDVLALTLHNKVHYTKELVEYAKSKGILLIPGVERTIQGMHVLIYNISQEEMENINTLEDLEKVRRKDTLIVAPHPYFRKFSCLGKNLEKYKHLFDAVEFCYFYTPLVNFNKKAVKFAKKENKTLIANSDTHFMDYFTNHHFSWIDANKDVQSIIDAIKEGKVKITSRPISHFHMAKTLYRFRSKK